MVYLTDVWGAFQKKNSTNTPKGVTVAATCHSFDGTLNAHLVAVAHHVVARDQGFVHHHPVAVLRPFDQQIGQLGDGHVRLVRAVHQV